MDTVPLLDSADLLDDTEALAARLDRDGYLLLRGLLPRQAVLDVRERVLAVLAARGWLAAGTSIMDGVADVEAYAAVPREEIAFCGVGIGADAYREIYHLEAFHALAHQPALLKLYARLFGGPVLPQPRTIARVMIPSELSPPTPPHQDFIHIQGSPRTMTAWLPLGDCDVDLGGLSTLVGSHREGLLSYRPSDGPGSFEAYLCDMPQPWAVGDYEAGDVITFTAHTVHRALPNHYADRVRLSADFRYQPVGSPIVAGSLQPHCDVDTWENIYRGWSDPSLQFFWQTPELTHGEWDESIRWQQDRIC